MLPIFVCEDDEMQRKQLESYIKDTIMIEDYDMNIELSVPGPYELLEYIESNSIRRGIYFLDIELRCDMSGIELGSKIRNIDEAGKIIFVTTHGELAYMTFLYKVEALDYIMKDEPDEIKRRVKECIDMAYKRITSEENPDRKVYKAKVGDNIRVIPYDEIMFFEASTAPHKIILHTKTAILEFYGTMKSIEDLDECFIRCHKSYVVNKNNIAEINKTERTIEMINGEECYVSARAIRNLK